MNIIRKKIWIFSVIVSITASCGTNTDNPIYPIFTLIPPAAPSIVNLEAVQINDNPLEVPRVEFNLSYYVSNTEPQFQGYNLYITTASLPVETIIAGASGDLYLPLGYEPSFPHTPEEASTAAADLKTVRITDFKPAPFTVQFQRCERYFFRLRAVLIGNLVSQPGPELSGCAAIDTSFCPATTACSPNG